MAQAEVGDDVYGEDPTVNRLEERAAEILGKEAAIFVPTGTMGNTIAHEAAHQSRRRGDLRCAVAHSGLGAFDAGVVFRMPGAFGRDRRRDFELGQH